MDFVIVVMGLCISESEPFTLVQNSIPFDANKVSLCYTGCIHVIGLDLTDAAIACLRV